MDSSNDKRISNLIRYNSEQVIKRRELQAHLDVCLKALQVARHQFTDYARQHRTKGTQDGDAKADINDAMASMIDEAMVWQSEPGSMGKP